MAKVCDITGKRAITGNNVSHSMRHTKRRFLPNLNSKTLYSDVLGQNVRLSLTSNALRTIDKYDGLDNFMLTIKPRKTETFSDAALKVRKMIMKRAEAKAVAAS